MRASKRVRGCALTLIKNAQANRPERPFDFIEKAAGVKPSPSKKETVDNIRIFTLCAKKYLKNCNLYQQNKNRYLGFNYNYWKSRNEFLKICGYVTYIYANLANRSLLK